MILGIAIRRLGKYGIKLKDINFWANKKVFVTGNTGFKGSWLSIWLNHLGARVNGYSLKPVTKPSLFEEADIKKSFKTHFLDIRNYDKLRKEVSSFDPEIVFHLAAQPLVRDSYEDPLKTYETNILGTANLLESLRYCESIKAIVIITTDKCYLNKELEGGYVETDELGGHDPYSNSKACCELVTHSYRESFFKEKEIGVATARAGNVIGGGDWAKDRLIPDVVENIAHKQDIEIRFPNAIRPWQHVLEPLAGYILLAERLYDSPNEFSEAWNFGPTDQDCKKVNWIVERIISAFNSDSKIVPQTGYHPHETKTLKLDISKSMDRLDWKPIWRIDEAIFNLVSWCKAREEGKSAWELCLKDIVDYQSSLTDG